MEILIVYNPRAGRGMGEATADAVDRALRADGHVVRRRLIGSADPSPPRAVSLNFESAPVHGAKTTVGLPRPPATSKAPPAASGAPEPIGRADLVIVVGGDGTLHHILSEVAPRRAAVCQLPLGTENLFAREFGMTTDPAGIAAAVRAWRLRDIDVARCNGRPFAIMCSVGPDAGVVRRLAAARRGAISHRDYIKPVVQELFEPALPRLTITVDGKAVVSGLPGMVVVANCRQYALRIDPAPRADAGDGFLDVAFIPGETALGLLARLIGARLRFKGRGVVRVRGRKIRIEGGGPRICAQLDGEVGPECVDGKLGLDFDLEQAALRVLLTAPGQGPGTAVGR